MFGCGEMCLELIVVHRYWQQLLLCASDSVAGVSAGI